MDARGHVRAEAPRFLPDPVDRVLRREGAIQGGRCRARTRRVRRWVERGSIKAAFDRSKTDASDLIGVIVFWTVSLITLQLAFGIWGPNPMSDLLAGVIAYLPKLIVAVVILVIAAMLAKVAPTCGLRGSERSVRARSRSSLASPSGHRACSSLMNAKAQERCSDPSDRVVAPPGGLYHAPRERLADHLQTMIIPVLIATGWINSVTYVAALSLWALVRPWSAWQAARVEVKQEQKRRSERRRTSRRGRGEGARR